MTVLKTVQPPRQRQQPIILCRLGTNLPNDSCDPARAAMVTIKGYLPVRVKFSSFMEEAEQDETFFYVKEHQQKDQGATANDTLFVTNAPVIPQIRTRVLLKALLGRFGDVKRVTAVDNPLKFSLDRLDEYVVEQRLSWTQACSAPSFLAESGIEGSFAHVVFNSNKEMKRALKEMQKLMSGGRAGSNCVQLDTIELQTLRDTSARQRAHGDDDANPEDDENETIHETKSGLQAVVDRYQSHCRKNTRSLLLEECNAVMESFEDAEEQARRSRVAASSTPDDDGFVVVSHSSQVGSKQELEQDSSAGAERRRKGQKRNRKKKQGAGASELADFYRFQTKVNRKRTVQELRERFEDDLAKLKRMKDEKQFRPF